VCVRACVCVCVCVCVRVRACVRACVNFRAYFTFVCSVNMVDLEICIVKIFWLCALVLISSMEFSLFTGAHQDVRQILAAKSDKQAEVLHEFEGEGTNLQ